MNIEELTVKQICNCIAVINKMMEEKLIKFNPNTDYVVNFGINYLNTICYYDESKTFILRNESNSSFVATKLTLRFHIVFIIITGSIIVV